MKITIEEIIEKYEEDYLPHVGDAMIAIINTVENDDELASVIPLYETKALAIKRRNKQTSIYLPFEQEFEVDCTGSFEIIMNDEQMSITLMVPLVFPELN